MDSLITRAVWSCFTLGLILAGVTGLPAAEPHGSLPPAGVIDGLGVNIHFTDPRPGEMEMLAEGGFRWVRMDFGWSRTERARGTYDFAPYDRLLAALEKHHVRALLILDYSNELYESNRSVVTEEGRRAFARWAAAAARHFQGRGILWEIWNEPNISGFWKPQPDVKQYTALALAAARAIREAAPGEAIIGPATSTIDLAFLEGCFQAGLLEWWDGVSVHPYRQSPPETAAAEYAKLRRLIEQYAPPQKTVPMLSAEWGYSAAWKNFNADRQGQMLTRQWLTNLSQEIPLSIWYDWHDDGQDEHESEHHFGTVAFDYHAGRVPVYDPKPAFQAARTLTQVLAGYRFTKRLATDRAADFALLFSRDERQCLAVWTTAAAGARELTLPSSDCEFDVVHHTGERGPNLVARDGLLKVSVTDRPQFLIARGANADLAAAPVAHPFQVTVVPGPGRALTVEVQNLSQAEFKGTVRLVDVEGVQPATIEQPLELLQGATAASVRFPLRADPTDPIQVGVQIVHAAGHRVFTLPPQRIVLLPSDLLTVCRVISDGDAQVASSQSLSVEVAPQPLAQSDAPVVRLVYQFGDGWKFARILPAGGARLAIEGQPRAFALWIYGDKRRTSPRLRVVDATGQTWQPTGPKIDWEGWRYVEFPLTEATGHWGGAEDGQIHWPLVWDSLFLLDNPARTAVQGAIYLAQPAIVY